MRAQQAATIVLPEPTSPCSRRRMGKRPPMSWRSSRRTRVCAGVSGKPSARRKGRMRWLSPGARQRARLALQLPAAALDGELQLEELVEGQAGAGAPGLGEFRGKMQIADGVGERREFVGRERGDPGMRIDQERAEALERSPDHGAQGSLGQALGEAVDRHNAIHVNRTLRGRGVLSGGDHDFRLGMVDVRGLSERGLP